MKPLYTKTSYRQLYTYSKYITWINEEQFNKIWSDFNDTKFVDNRITQVFNTYIGTRNEVYI